MREVEGARVEELVESLYPDSLRMALDSEYAKVSDDCGGGDEFLVSTALALRDQHALIQAHIKSDGFLAVVDVLESTPDGWFIWEVKASTSLKPIHDHDLAFQAQVARLAGLK